MQGLSPCPFPLPLFKLTSSPRLRGVRAALLSLTYIQLRPARPVAAVSHHLRTTARTRGPGSALDKPVTPVTNLPPHLPLLLYLPVSVPDSDYRMLTSSA